MKDPRETRHRLYLLRHAKSSWGDAGLADHDRPLAPRGEKAAREVAEHARKRGIEPALVLCSTAVRARQTLAAFSFAGRVSYEDGLYGASAGDLVARLRRLPDELPEAMVVAHNPGLQELALLLIGEGGGPRSHACVTSCRRARS